MALVSATSAATTLARMVSDCTSTPCIASADMGQDMATTATPIATTGTYLHPNQPLAAELQLRLPRTSRTQG